MANVKFKETNPNDKAELVFSDDKGNEYCLFSDSRGRGVEGINPDFWDKFFFCKKVVVDYVSDRDRRKITKVISYK